VTGAHDAPTRRVVVPSTALVAELGDLPPGVELVELDPAAGVLSAEVLSADVIVLAAELRDLVPTLGDFGSLQFVQTLNAGVEMMLPYVPDGVTFCNASGVHDGPVAEWVVGVLIALRRGLDRFVRAQAERRWDVDGNALTTPPELIPFDDLDGMRVLIVGYGSIGQRIEALLTPFGCTFDRIAFRERTGVHPPEALDGLLPQADAVVLMAPLTDATRGLLDRRRLALLPDRAIVVNGSRGTMIEQAALEAELRAGRLRAALDVTDPEPLPPDATLWDAPGLLITPHTAGSSRRWSVRAYRFAGDQLRRWSAGEPLENVRTGY
jgi:phosphoglycerate dehydrogenase-like enzyme